MPGAPWRSAGRGPLSPHDQVLRNQSVGSTCSVGRLGSAIVDGDLDENVVRRRLRVFDEHVEIAVLIEHAGVEQLVLEVLRVRLRLVATRSSYGNGACGYLYRYFMYECVGVESR